MLFVGRHAILTIFKHCPCYTQVLNLGNTMVDKAEFIVCMNMQGEYGEEEADGKSTKKIG